MKALSIKHSAVTRESLLRMAEEIPGAWIGIRIAGYLLILSGWTSSQVAEMFGLTRWAVVKWIHKANEEGLQAVKDRPRPGKPSQFSEDIMGELEQTLSKSPKEVGIARQRWDGVVLAEYLKRSYHINVHVRHAQRLIRKLGFSLRRPVYRFVQASQEGVEEFCEEVKKNSTGPQKQR